MTLDRNTAALLEQFAAQGGKPLHESTPEEARLLAQNLAALSGPGPEMGRVENHEIPVADGVVRVRVLVPQQPARGVMVYYHGGGWVLGSVDDYDTLARKLAERTSCAVVLVGYRLAPEHRYPVAVDDAYAALEWVSGRLDAIAGSGVPLIVAGDSAGGNLAAVMALRAREATLGGERDAPRIGLQVLIYPVTDADFGRPSYTDEANQLLLTREGMVWFWDHYAPDPARRTEAYATPLQATDLAGLPPAVVLVAEHDVLRDEGEAYASRLIEANVTVNCKLYHGQMHGFFTLLMLPGSELGFQQVVRAVKARIIELSKSKRVRA